MYDGGLNLYTNFKTRERQIAYGFVTGRSRGAIT